MSVNKRKHILFISAWFPTTVNRYNGDFVQRHAKAVSLMNDVTVIHCIGVDDLEKAYTEHHKDGEQYQELIYYFPKSKLRLINLIRKTWAYHRLAKQVKPYELIHANVFHYSILWVFLQRMFRGKKVVLTEHSGGYVNGSPKPIQVWYNRFFAPFIHNIMPVSNTLKNAMMDKNILSKYVVVPNVINTDTFGAETSRRQSEVVTFVHLSYLDDSIKNYMGMLEAAKRLNQQDYDFQFIVGGPASETDKQVILSIIEQNNLHHKVTVVGSLSHDEVAELMKKADCFVLFSNIESFSCVKFESFSVGTPVIASNLEPLQEWFPNNFGFLVEKGNVNQLVQAMIKVIDGHPFAEPEVMHEYVEKHFSPEVIAQQYDTVYSKALSTK